MFALLPQVQSGAHPVVSDLHAVRTLFSGPPLGIRRMDADQMVSGKYLSNYNLLLK